MGTRVLGDGDAALTSSVRRRGGGRSGDKGPRSQPVCLPGGRWAGEGGAVFQSQTHRPTSSSRGRRQTFCGEGGSCICGSGEEAAWRPSVVPGR